MFRPGKTSPWWALTMLTCIYICGFIDRIIMQVLVEPVKAEFALSDFQIGIVAGLAFAVLNVVLGLWVARVAERRRRMSLVAVGTVLWSIATAACGMANSFVQLVLARISVGVGEAVGLPSSSSIISDYFPRTQRTTALSVLMLSPPVGAFIGFELVSAAVAVRLQTDAKGFVNDVFQRPVFLCRLFCGRASLYHHRSSRWFS